MLSPHLHVACGQGTDFGKIALAIQGEGGAARLRKKHTAYVSTGRSGRLRVSSCSLLEGHCGVRTDVLRVLRLLELKKCWLGPNS